MKPHVEQNKHHCGNCLSIFLVSQSHVISGWLSENEKLSKRGGSHRMLSHRVIVNSKISVIRVNYSQR